KGAEAPQAWPQLPQLLASLWVLVQLPLQMAFEPDGQQVPVTQEPPQTLPQPPQLLSSVCVSAQYGTPVCVQNVCPEPQMEPQLPLEHTWLVPQTWLHEPQFALSVWSSAQYGVVGLGALAAGHADWLPTHVDAQWPVPSQVCSTPHLLPHDP